MSIARIIVLAPSLLSFFPADFGIEPTLLLFQASRRLCMCGQPVQTKRGREQKNNIPPTLSGTTDQYKWAVAAPLMYLVVLGGMLEIIGFEM